MTRRFTVPAAPRPFRYEGEVEAGEKRQFRSEVSETSLGDPVAVPVTIINGEEPGPQLSRTTATATNSTA